MTCPACGHAAPPEARFCASCGQPLRAHSGERRVVSVLFADLAGFTALSERRDPEQVARIVDRAFQRLVRDVTAFGGRVDKIVGDAIVALFGAPVAHEDDAERAVRAALRMHATLASFAADAGVEVRMRIGVNTGEVLVGALRAGGDYTAMGDVVNTAARLQTMCEPGQVLVGAATRSATGDAIDYDPVGSVQPRGRDAPVEVWRAVATRRPPGYRSTRVSTPIVGREAELELLGRALDLSLGHRRGLITVLLGEAGLGKTRLAHEADSLAQEIDPETFILNGRCVPYGEANPWWPIADALRDGCGLSFEEDLVSARAAVTARVAGVVDAPASVEPVVNGLLHLMGYEGPLRGLEPARAREDATQALLTFIEASVRRRPIVVRLADLHWADDLVLELIDNLAGQLARQPFVLLATARPELLDRWTPRAGRHHVLCLTIDALDRHAAGQLVDSLEPDLDPVVRDDVLDRGGGNPFFLEELVTLVRRSGGLVGAGRLPDNLRGLVAARIDGLSTDEQLTLEDASVWGSDGPLEALNRLAAATRGVDDVTEMVQSLAEQDILDVEDDHWSFRSDVMREVAYQRLTKVARLQRHAGIAGYLDHHVVGRFVEDAMVEVIARHYREAALLSREVSWADLPADLDVAALRWAGEAARRAEASASWTQAIRWCTHALELVDHTPGGRSTSSSDGRVAFLLGRARARLELWQIEEARADAESALAASSPGDDLQRAVALTRLGEIDARAGARADAERQLAEAVALFERAGDRHGRGEALRRMGMARLLTNAELEAEEPIAEALDDLVAVGDRRGAAWALQHLAWIAFVQGDTARADERLDAAQAAFDTLGDQGGLAWTAGLRAFVRLNQGRFDDARSLGTAVLREGERRGDRWAQGMMLVVLGATDLWQGRTVAAAGAGQAATERFRSLRDTVGLEQALVLEGRARVMLGETERGLELLEEAGRLHHPQGEPEARGRWSLGRIAASAARVFLGDPRAVLAQDGMHDVQFDGSGVGQTDLLNALALAQAQLGHTADARSNAARALTLDPGSGSARGTAALVAAASGDGDDAVRLQESLAQVGNATYLDRVMAALAVALAVPARRSAGFDEASLLLAGTGDLVAEAVLSEFRAGAARIEGAADAEDLTEDAGQRWRRLGVDPYGWRHLVELAMSTPTRVGGDQLG